MKVSYCGYAAHGQIDSCSPPQSHSACTSVPLFFTEDVRTASCSWSNIAVVSESGEKLHIHGFTDNDKHINPFEIGSPNGQSIRQVVSCRASTLVVTEENSCWELRGACWSPVTLPGGAGIQGIACSEGLVLALACSGQVFDLKSGARLQTPEAVVSLACGAEHALAVSHTGDVYAWGNSSRGQLGHGELSSQDAPIRIAALSGLSVIQVSCGNWHSAAVTASGDLYCWGWNRDGQLGFPCILPQMSDVSQGTEEEDCVSVLGTPHPVDLPLGVRQVACGARHTVVLTDDGSVWGCGWNQYGQLGAQPTPGMTGMRPLPLPAGSRSTVGRVAAGGWGSLFFTS